MIVSITAMDSSKEPTTTTASNIAKDLAGRIQKNNNVNSAFQIKLYLNALEKQIENFQYILKYTQNGLDDKDFLLYSKNAFFNKGDFQNQIIFTSYYNEILNLKLKKVFNNIDKIIFSIKFNKLNLVNKICR